MYFDLLPTRKTSELDWSPATGQPTEPPEWKSTTHWGDPAVGSSSSWTAPSGGWPFLTDTSRRRLLGPENYVGKNKDYDIRSFLATPHLVGMTALRWRGLGGTLGIYHVEKRRKRMRWERPIIWKLLSFCLLRELLWVALMMLLQSMVLCNEKVAAQTSYSGTWWRKELLTELKSCELLVVKGRLKRAKRINLVIFS